MEDLNFNNTLSNSSVLEKDSVYEQNKSLYTGLSAVYLCIALVAAVGNGLVLYISCENRNNGPLRNFDSAIRSLAVADMLYGLIGMPCRVINNYFEGMCNDKKILYTKIL